MPARHCLGARSAPPCLGVLQLQDEPTYGLTGKKQGRGTGLSHRSCENRAKPCKLFVSCKLFHMQKPCKTVQAVRVMQKNVQAVPHAKTAQNRASCSTCHARCSTCEKNKLFHMQKPCKTVQKTNMSKCHVSMFIQKPCKNHAKTMQNAARTKNDCPRGVPRGVQTRTCQEHVHPTCTPTC